MSTAAAKTKSKKTATAKKPLSHPTFAEMITDAIVSLKERTGSSQYAIQKFIEEKHKELPPTFRKLLLHNLKKSVAAGKLVKVKNSFKLAPTKSAPVKAPATAAATKKPKAETKPKPKPKPSAKAATKPKAKAAAKPKAAVKPKAKAKTAAAAAKPKAKPAKAPAAKKVGAKIAKKTPVKGVKKPKSVKSPAKKAKK